MEVPSTSTLVDEYRYFLEFAATVIQRHFRGYLVRREFHRQAKLAAEEYQAREHAESIHQLQTAAALRIQHAWQSFRNKRIFNYYRDLIQFRERGDPREMLRAINPREATLIDAAAGVHVRFRLGGSMFPPLVFYKCFTHRTVTDINAFGPRNYAAEVSMTARQVHSKPVKRKKQIGQDFKVDDSLRQYIKPDGTLGYRNTFGWYERVENNGWRPVAESLLLGEDPVTTSTRLRAIANFHYNPAVRREERLRRAKQRKRDWLRKLYVLTQAPGHDGSPHLPGSFPTDLADEDLDNLQVDELLDWSQHLDFQNYVSDWTGMACTLGSEAFMPEANTAPTARLPAPDMDVHAAMSAAGVPLPPFRGGATAASGVTSGLLVN